MMALAVSLSTTGVLPSPVRVMLPWDATRASPFVALRAPVKLMTPVVLVTFALLPWRVYAPLEPTVMLLSFVSTFRSPAAVTLPSMSMISVALLSALS